MHSFSAHSDSCKKTAVVLKGAIGTVEFINCQSMECQVQAVSGYSVIKKLLLLLFVFTEFSPCN